MDWTYLGDGKISRHDFHYGFCHLALRSLVFEDRDFVTELFDTLEYELKTAGLFLSEFWNLKAEEFGCKDLLTTYEDFSVYRRHSENPEWEMTVITPPPAIETPEAQQIGLLFNRSKYDLQRSLYGKMKIKFYPQKYTEYIRYICLEVGDQNVTLTPTSYFQIGEWLRDGSRGSYGTTLKADIESTFQVLEGLIANSYSMLSRGYYG